MLRFYTASSRSSSIPNQSDAPLDSSTSDGSSSSDGQARTPREMMRLRCRMGRISATELALEHMSSANSTPQHARRTAVVNSIAGFYSEKLESKINGEYVGFDAVRLEAQAHQIRQPSALAALNRTASFVLIAPVMENVERLIDADTRNQLPTIRAEDRTVLDEAILAVQVCVAATEADAVGAARDGTRGMPLSLDQARFQTFLAEQEPALTAVIDACARPAPVRAQTLQPLLQTLAEQYFISAGRRLNGMPAGTSTFYNGERVGPAPVELLIGVTAANDGLHVTNRVSCHEQVIVSMGNSVMDADDSEEAELDPDRHSLSPAQRRGIEILGKFFRTLTELDEQVIARAVQVPADAARLRRQSRGTMAELSYVGDLRTGDTCHLAFGPSQRERSMRPLRLLPQQMRYHQDAFGAPMLGNQEAREWVLGPTFHADLDTIMLPAARLPNAQVESTDRLLLATQAFSEQIAEAKSAALA